MLRQIASESHGLSAVSGPLQVKQLEEQVQSTRTAIVCAFNQLLDLKDLNTGVHSTRLAEWAVRVAESLGIDDSVLRDVEAAAILTTSARSVCQMRSYTNPAS